MGSTWNFGTLKENEKVRANLAFCSNGAMVAQRLQDLLLFLESTAAAAAGAAHLSEALRAKGPIVTAWLQICRNRP